MKQYLNGEFPDVAEGDFKGCFQGIEELLIQRYVLNTEMASQHLNGQLVVLDSVDILAEFLDHDLLNN